MPQAMSNYEAWIYAASWGSYMSSGDPGACMYGFDERFLVQSEAHRSNCLDWMDDCRASVEARPGDYDEDELEKMDAFIAALKATKVED